MAKFTELFSEYLERGGLLPASFSQIEGFENLFKLHYCDKEIGFETETLFAMKLEAKANMVIPIYADKISRLATAYLGFDEPAKTFYEHIVVGTTIGEQNGSTTELPFDSPNALPSVKNHFDEYENGEDRVTERRDAGETIDEKIRQIDFINKEVTSLLEKCLKEFKNLFMGVY